MRISTLGYTIKQGFSNINRNKMFSLASIATMSACIFIFGLFYSIITNFQHIVKSAEEGVAVTVFFDENITDDRISEIGKELEAQSGVREIKFVSSEEAWESFQKEYFGDNASLADGFKDDNPLANSANYEVYMSDVSMQSQVVSFAEGLEGVRKVNKSDVVAKTLSSVNVLISYGAIAIFLILLAVSIFLISNTVTIGITVRSEEIAIMKYIGAKDAFVRMPFLTEGILIGLIGSAIPLVVLYFLYSKVIEYVLDKFSLLNNILEFLSVGYVYKTLLPISILLGVGIGFVGSFFTTRKHLKV